MRWNDTGFPNDARIWTALLPTNSSLLQQPMYQRSPRKVFKSWGRPPLKRSFVNQRVIEDFNSRPMSVVESKPVSTLRNNQDKVWQSHSTSTQPEKGEYCCPTVSDFTTKIHLRIFGHVEFKNASHSFFFNFRFDLWPGKGQTKVKNVALTRKITLGSN